MFGRILGAFTRLLRNVIIPLSIRFVLTLVFLFFPSPGSAEKAQKSSQDEAPITEYRLYRDITQAQSELAHDGLRRSFSGDFDQALKIFRRMEKIENQDSLPPLSQLMVVASGVLLLERSDFADEDAAAGLLQAVKDAAEQGQYLCQTALRRQPNHPTYQLIQGGIQGFLATLKIDSQPTRAMQDGFQALKLLERALAGDGRLKDAYMGSGIFQCTAANAPLFVRGALKLVGRSVNINKGLSDLRTSAYEGQYTSVASQLFLVQFLSPYEDELRREKRQIFTSLETEFSGNPYFTFLKYDEALCFYPDSFFNQDAQQVEKGFKRLRANNYVGNRYLNILRWQIALLHPEGQAEVAVDSTFDLREYKFYPVFTEGLRRRHEFEDSLKRNEVSLDPKEIMANYRDTTLFLLNHSTMNPASKRYNIWRIKDALRLKNQAPAAIAEPGG